MVNNFQEQGSDDPVHRQRADFEQKTNARYFVGGAASLEQRATIKVKKLKSICLMGAYQIKSCFIAKASTQIFVGFWVTKK